MNMKQTILTTLLALVALMGQAQKHLPEIQYSLKPAVLKGRVVKASAEESDTVRVYYLLRYTTGMGDARRWQGTRLDGDGCFTMELPIGMTHQCEVMVGQSSFTCYIVPGETVSFTLDEPKMQTHGLRKALKFGGALPDFNLDVAYAISKGIDPCDIYLDIERKRNTNQLLNELPQKNEEGYFDYLKATYERVNAQIDADKHLGTAYREFAKAVNLYQWGDMMMWCGQSIQYQGLKTEEDYDAYNARLKRRYEQYMQDDPWANPLLSYVMWSLPDTFIDDLLEEGVKLPDSYRKCYLANRYLQQMGQDKELLSEAQQDSVRTLLPELAPEVLGYHDRMERELAFVGEQGLSRVCELPADIPDGDVLSAIIVPYRGKPILLDLWETTCGPCRLAFKEMHSLKLELGSKIQFVDIASEHSNHDTWQKLIPNYIGDHYYLTQSQLEALHRRLPCETNAVPIWVLINADGTIHHAFVGYRDVESMMKELAEVEK